MHSLRSKLRKHRSTRVFLKREASESSPAYMDADERELHALLQQQCGSVEALLAYVAAVPAAFESILRVQAGLREAKVERLEGVEESSRLLLAGLQESAQLVGAMAQCTQGPLEALRATLQACAEDCRNAEEASNELERYSSKFRDLADEHFERQEHGKEREKEQMRYERNRAKLQRASVDASVARQRARDSLQLCAARRPRLAELAQGALASTAEAFGRIVRGFGSRSLLSEAAPPAAAAAAALREPVSFNPFDADIGIDDLSRKSISPLDDTLRDSSDLCGNPFVSVDGNVAADESGDGKTQPARQGAVTDPSACESNSGNSLRIGNREAHDRSPYGYDRAITSDFKLQILKDLDVVQEDVDSCEHIDDNPFECELPACVCSTTSDDDCSQVAEDESGDAEPHPAIQDATVTCPSAWESNNVNTLKSGNRGVHDRSPYGFDRAITSDFKLQTCKDLDVAQEDGGSCHHVDEDPSQSELRACVSSATSDDVCIVMESFTWSEFAERDPLQGGKQACERRDAVGSHGKVQEPSSVVKSQNCPVTSSSDPSDGKGMSDVHEKAEVDVDLPHVNVAGSDVAPKELGQRSELAKRRVHFGELPADKIGNVCTKEIDFERSEVDLREIVRAG
eukprot:TRINITY_DN10160_c0_g1_i1.p1 TRINITY_DN10160_c0_g1~~TRINITY_DN10160_c0_g1_i1.p1  ORF type:complete len:642 (-),score=129.48 TRINITY_DN10160_c0_g1_i1:148-2031(-)